MIIYEVDHLILIAFHSIVLQIFFVLLSKKEKYVIDPKKSSNRFCSYVHLSFTSHAYVLKVMCTAVNGKV